MLLCIFYYYPTCALKLLMLVNGVVCVFMFQLPRMQVPPWIMLHFKVVFSKYHNFIATYMAFSMSTTALTH